MNTLEENELASVKRVRNRLAMTRDQDLPRILTNLLPRVLTKLAKLNPVETQSQLLGVVSHTVERILGDTAMVVPWLDRMLPFLVYDERLVRASALRLLAVGIPKCEPSTTLLTSLWRHVDQSYRRVMKDPNEETQQEWYYTSWLCLDSVAVRVNLEPMIDWDMVDFDPHTYKEPESALVASSDMIETVSSDGSGVFDFFLDIFLFQVEEVSRFFGRPMSDGLSSGGNRRMAFRRQNRRWNDHTRALMKELRYACFKYAIMPLEAGLFQGPEGSVGKRRCLILCLLMAAKNSRIGRLAADVLNHLMGRRRLEKVGPSARFC